MFSKTKMAAGLAGVASLFLIGSTTLAAVSASAAPTDPVGCSVQGTVTISGPNGGLTTAPANNHFSFTSATLTCHGAPGNDDAGDYTVSANGNTTGISPNAGEDCTQGQSAGAAAITGNGPDGAASGSFTFTRTGSAVTITDGVFTAGGETHHFTAALQFTPTAGNCATTPVTEASITGSAHITEDSES